MWIDIACIVFSCVTMNHLGLIQAIERIAHTKLHVLNCAKCSTFWFVLAYSVFVSHDVITSLAISFFCAYLAIWVELYEGIIDALYLMVYEKVYDDTDNDTSTADTDGGNSECSVP